MKKSYVYYALFSHADDGITVEYPDLPGCISCGFSNEEAIQMAQEALKLYLDGMKEEQIPIPRSPSEIKNTSINQKIIPIEVEID